MGSKVYIVAGEVSGDNHGSGLMTEMGALDSEIQFYGCLLYTSDAADE